MADSELEEAFLGLWRVIGQGIPEPRRQFGFHPTRRWRFDFAWPAQRVALEMEGGTFTGGRHVRGLGYEMDIEKYNNAVVLGWAVLRATRLTLARDPVALMALIRYTIESRSPNP